MSDNVNVRDYNFVSSLAVAKKTDRVNPRNLKDAGCVYNSLNPRRFLAQIFGNVGLDRIRGQVGSAAAKID